MSLEYRVVLCLGLMLSVCEHTCTHTYKAPMRFDSQLVLFILMFVYVFSQLHVHMDKILSEITVGKFYK